MFLPTSESSHSFNIGPGAITSIFGLSLQTSASSAFFTSLLIPSAIFAAVRENLCLQSFVPSIITSISSGECVCKHGKRYVSPESPSLKGSSRHVVLPQSPSSSILYSLPRSLATTIGHLISSLNLPPVAASYPHVFESP